MMQMILHCFEKLGIVHPGLASNKLPAETREFIDLHLQLVGNVFSATDYWIFIRTFIEI